MTTDYEFVTHWEFTAPVERIWHEIIHPLDWPAWWRGVVRVVPTQPATGDDGLGSKHLITWKSALPYRLTFESHAVRCERYRFYEIDALGELTGHGLWTFSVDGPVTRVRYDWSVKTTKLWMRLFAPVARPLFRWNHDVLMRWGYEGLSARLSSEPEA